VAVVEGVGVAAVTREAAENSFAPDCALADGSGCVPLRLESDRCVRTRVPRNLASCRPFFALANARGERPATSKCELAVRSSAPLGCSFSLNSSATR
jgi:hypothetical protein